MDLHTFGLAGLRLVQQASAELPVIFNDE